MLRAAMPTADWFGTILRLAAFMRTHLANQNSKNVRFEPYRYAQYEYDLKTFEDILTVTTIGDGKLQGETIERVSYFVEKTCGCFLPHVCFFLKNGSHTTPPPSHTHTPQH